MFGFEVLSLLAQTDTATAATGSWLDGIIMLALIVAVVVVPFLLGNFVANSVLKMREYGWKIGLIFFAITASFVVILLGWPPNLGVDLQGGTILVYEIQDQEDGAPPIDKGALIQQLSRRVNPTGTREIVIRPYGEREIEIIIPKLPPDEIERIKDILRQQGALEFRIVADTTEPRHDDAIKEARKPENSREEKIRSSTKTINETNDGFDVDESKQKVIGYWTKMGRAAEELSIAVPEFTDASGKSVKRIRPFLSEGLIGGPHLFRIAATDQPLDVTQLDLARPEVSLAKLGIGDIEVFMFADDGWDVIGDDIASVRQSIGSDRGGNEVAFNMNTLGAPKMAGLTGAYSPDSSTGKDYHMGIVLDNELISAPTIQSTISDSGRITGRFTNAEIKFLVEILQAGKLPATLSKAPISENVIDPLLGAANVVQGCWAIGISFGLVLIFMLVYYRIAGVVACFALGANIALILAVMIAIKAAFTLPGLAGLVLTVGMAVDANVLIFERIREEMNRGSALRLAIRNGFAKATTTIVDANVTTLITAIVLYAIGTDQIRGFAVTLILGIVMSMFTAIFCSRVTFEIIERKKWLTSLNMMQALTETSFNFLGKRRIALAVSAVVIVIGLVAVGFRGATIFDIDFRGGYSVSFALSEVKTTEEVRNLLDPAFKALGDEAGESTQFTLVKVGGGEGYEGRIFKLDASIPSQEGETPEATTSRLKSLIATTLSGLLEKRTVTISDEAVNTPETPAPEETSAMEDPFGLLNQGESFITLLDDPSEEAPAVDGSDDTEPADPAATEPTDEKPEEPAEPAAEPNDPAEPVSDGSEPTAPVEPSDTPEPTDPAEPAEPAEPTDAAEPAADSAEPTDSTEPTDPKEPADSGTGTPITGGGGEFDPNAGGTPVDPVSQLPQVSASLEFSQEISGPALSGQLNKLADASNVDLQNLQVEPGAGEDAADWTPDAGYGFHTWKVSAAGDSAEFNTLLNDYKEKIDTEIYWRSSSTIGGAVAGKMQQMAIVALLASLIGIIGYIWIRFQRVVYGLAAVIALLHDVAVTLGAVAVSYWLAPYLGFVQMEEFKISLPVVAAFLTIIGYSLNDTIVVFDRIREVRGKNPRLSEGMINLSINQTLSRTLLTSITTLIVVVILYFLGGAAIHGFAFALVVGVLVGTYSSIFVASPALLWMVSLSQDASDDKGSKKKEAKAIA